MREKPDELDSTFVPSINQTDFRSRVLSRTGVGIPPEWASSGYPCWVPLRAIEVRAGFI
jgi:hypothetical protein